MRQSTKIILTTTVAVVTTGVVFMLGLDHALAQAFQGDDVRLLATTDTKLSGQLGGAAQLMKQGSVVLGAAMGVGGAYKFYANAKESFKGGAKDFVSPVVMALAGGAMMAVPYLTQVGGKTIGATGSEQLQKETGGKIGW